MLKYSNSNNQIIAQKIAELTINNYEKGLAIKNQQEGQPDDIDDNNVNTIVPTTDVSIKTKSGYSVKDKNKNKVIASAGKSFPKTLGRSRRRSRPPVRARGLTCPALCPQRTGRALPRPSTDARASARQCLPPRPQMRNHRPSFGAT